MLIVLNCFDIVPGCVCLVTRLPSLVAKLLPGYQVQVISKSSFTEFRGVLWRAKSHFVTKMAGHGSPKFNEPWMDELDGENCIQRTVSFAVQGALVGR